MTELPVKGRRTIECKCNLQLKKQSSLENFILMYQTKISGCRILVCKSEKEFPHTSLLGSSFTFSECDATKITGAVLEL